MSGIIVVFDRNGVSPQDDFMPVFRALNHRGHDGADAETFDHVALGHQHFYTTPEEVGEQQPIEFDGLWVTMDGRIDNRGELFEQLADAGTPARAGVSDAELVLRTYQAFGDEFLERLIGAFALAIWDPADEHLLVARDKTGIRKLYYADLGDTVVVASEMAAIVEHPAVPADINEGFVAEVLASHYVTNEETFFAAVDPLLPGSFLKIKAESTRTESYWEVWNADVEQDPDKSTAEELHDRIQTAVASRLRSPEQTGVMMSGGLDSTTIAGFARRHLDRTGHPDINLSSYSLFIDGVEYFEPELDRIHDTVNAFGMKMHTVRANEHYCLADLELFECLARETGVFSGVSSANKALFEQAADLGTKTLFTGIWGNIFDGSRLYYTDLIRQGRVGTFLRDGYRDQISFKQLILWYVLAQFSDHVGQFAMEWTGRAEPDVPEWINDEFAERTGLAKRVSREIETGIPHMGIQQQFKNHYYRPRSFEDAMQRQLALRSGVDLMMPFLDSRVLSFVASLSPGKLRKGDRDKVLFRQAVENVLPDSVRNQTASVTFDPLVKTSFYDKRADYVENLFENSKLIERGIVDEEAYKAHVASHYDPDQGQRPIWDLVSMELWLQQWA